MKIFMAAFFLAGLAGCAAPTSSAGTSESPPSAGVIDLAGLDVPPKVIRRAPPKYPFEMRQKGISGEVTVEFVVDTEGRARPVGTVWATNEQFAKAAVDCVCQWKFRPGIKAGRKVNCLMRQRISFSLKDEPPHR